MEYASRKIGMPEGGRVCESFVVGRQYLDGNHHVNNGQYIHMAMDYLPADFEIGQMRAEYRKSALLHDSIVPIVKKEENRVTVSLCSEDQTPYAVVELTRK